MINHTKICGRSSSSSSGEKGLRIRVCADAGRRDVDDQDDDTNRTSGSDGEKGLRIRVCEDAGRRDVDDGSGNRNGLSENEVSKYGNDEGSNVSDRFGKSLRIHVSSEDERKHCDDRHIDVDDENESKYDVDKHTALEDMGEVRDSIESRMKRKCDEEQIRGERKSLEFLQSIWKLTDKLTKKRVSTIGNGIIKVQSSSSDVIMACKIFDLSSTSSSSTYEKTLTRLCREVRALHRLSPHRNVVKFLELQRTPSHAYLLLEYLEGVHGTQDLLEFVMRYAPLSEKLSRSIFEQLLCAVRHCHESDIAHRDIKPENIVVIKDKFIKIRVVLIDFGLSGNTTDNIDVKACGTPLYSAPEEFDMDRKISPKCADMWSLGVVLYVLVCGKLPFEASTLSKLREKVVNEKLDIPQSVSKSCAELLRGLCCKDAKQRFDIHQACNHDWIQRRRRTKSIVSPTSPTTTTTNENSTSVYPNAYWFSAPIASNDKTKSPILRSMHSVKKSPPPLNLKDDEEGNVEEELLPPKKSTSRGLHHWMYELQEEDEDEESEEEEEEEDGYWTQRPSPKLSPPYSSSSSSFSSKVPDETLIPPSKTRGIIVNNNISHVKKMNHNDNAAHCSTSSLADLYSDESVSFGEEEEEEEVEDGDGMGWYFGG